MRGRIGGSGGGGRGGGSGCCPGCGRRHGGTRRGDSRGGSHDSVGGGCSSGEARGRAKFVSIEVDGAVIALITLRCNRVEQGKRVIEVVIMALVLVLDCLLELSVALFQKCRGVAKSEESSTEAEPDFNQVILAGAGERFAKVGKKGSWRSMDVRPLFGELIGTDVPVDLELSATVAEKFGELAMVGGVIEMSRDPPNTKESICGGTVVTASWRSENAVNNVFNVLPKVVVGVSGRGTTAIEDFIELGHDGLVVTTDKHRGYGMLDNVGNGAELRTIGARYVGLEGLGGVGRTPSGNENAPPRPGKEGMKRVQGGAVGENLDERLFPDTVAEDIGNVVVDERGGVGFTIEDRVAATGRGGKVIVKLRVVRTKPSDLESAVIVDLLKLVCGKETAMGVSTGFKFVVNAVVFFPLSVETRTLIEKVENVSSNVITIGVVACVTLALASMHETVRCPSGTGENGVQSAATKWIPIAFRSSVAEGGVEVREG